MLLLIGLCGVCGACLRYALGDWLQQIYKGKIPIATFLINVMGSFLLGYLFKKYELGYIIPLVWSILGVGFLGAFTTFSTFSFEAISLWLKKECWLAGVYVITTLVLGFLFALLGYELG